jgi:tetratricopeptide (TPR) repeat protein
MSSGRSKQKSPHSDAELDAAELTHLAVKAMRSGRDDDALRLLQRAAERDPKDGNPHHLRGAILASQGEPEKAIEAMTQALALDPLLTGARFQLGLLHLTSGHVAEAQSVWQSFDELDERHSFRLFKTGMLHLAKDEFEDCIALLEEGISLCGSESINNDMRRVIERVRAVIPAKPQREAEARGQHDARHVMLARYEQSRDLNGDEDRRDD